MSQCVGPLAAGVGGHNARVVVAKKPHADKGLEIDDVFKMLRILRSMFYR